MMRLAALALLLTAAFPAAAAAGELPDVEQVAPYKISVVERDGRWYLGFATAARNIGPAALRIQGAGSGDRTMTARQLTGSGDAVLGRDVGTLRYVTTYGHGHWHYMGFMRYELRGVDVAGVLGDRKQGFCLADAPFVDGWCARGQSGLTTTELGIEPGGIDIYEPLVEGQEIEIDRETAPGGRYVLTSRIGPTGVLQETRTDNNVASVLIELEWPLAHRQPVPVLATCSGRCPGGLAAPRPPRMSAAKARRLARGALRRAAGRLPARGRIACRPVRRASRACRVRLADARLKISGTVGVRYVQVGAATRRRLKIDVVRRERGGRARRIRRG
jgi:Lysyl oxidase